MRKKNKIEPPIKYWCAVGTVKQTAFNDQTMKTYEIDVEHPAGEQHILYQGILMCRASRETLKNKVSAKKNKLVSKLIENVPLCKKCEKKYKENGDLAWGKWVSNVSVAPELHGVKSETVSILS